jgi:sugar lactone lactonase YvrE
MGYRTLKRQLGRRLAVRLPALLLCCLAAGCSGGAGSSASGPLGSACVSGVVGVAAGPGWSVYVQDSRGILHYSKKGKLLARLQPSRSDWAVDETGNVYYSKSGDIVRAAPTGRILARWRAPDMEPEAVDGKGDVVAARGGHVFAGDGPDQFVLFSSSGSALARWTSSFSAQMAFDRQGFIYTTGSLGGLLVRLDPLTGKAADRLNAPSGSSFDAVAADPAGTIYVGVTDSANAPFAVRRLTRHGSRFTFKTLNSSQEMVGGLAVDSMGTIFVIRKSYAESSSTNTGLEVLSRSGPSLGRVAACKK